MIIKGTDSLLAAAKGMMLAGELTKEQYESMARRNKLVSWEHRSDCFVAK